MIVKLDHVALNVTDTSRAMSALARLHYKPIFDARRVPTPRNKSSLSATMPPTHDLLLAEAPGKIPIELIGGPTPGPEGTIIPVMSGEARHLLADQLVRADESVPARLAPPLAGHVMIEPTAGSTGSSELVIMTSDVRAAADFFAGFGFRAMHTEKPDRLRFQGALDPFPLDIRLVGAVLAPRPRLDGCGFVCLAFVTTSIDRDLERLSSCGHEVTATAEISPNGTALSIAFAVGPAGEIVELIQPSRGDRK